MTTTTEITVDLAVDRLLTALGGREAVFAAETQTITARGTRHHPGWGTLPSKPELVASFDYTLVEDAVRPRYRLMLEGETYLVPAHLSYTEIGNGSLGHVDGIDFMFNPTPVDMPIASWRVATRQRHIDLTSVLRLARKLAAAGADVTASGTAMTLREPGRPPIRVLLGEDGLPASTQVTEEHSPQGDTLVEVAFGDYRAVGELMLPHRVTISAGGAVVHDETRSSIEIGASASDDDFAVSETEVVEASAPQMAYALYSTEWVMTYVLSGVRFYFDLQLAPTTPDAVTLAEGVKLVVGPSHNTLVVELPDSTLAVEAPLYDEYTHAALAQVKEAFPGKPLRTLVGTHFHYDHIGGIREFAADGDLTVLVGEPTVPFFTAIFDGIHAVDPDRYTGRPLPVTVTGVTDPVILPTADGGEVQIHRITSDHSEDMLIVYLSTSKSVFNSDLWNPTPAEPPVGAQRGRLATQLYDAIVDLGLDVETIIGGHSGTDGTRPIFTAPLAYLKTAAAR